MVASAPRNRKRKARWKMFVALPCQAHAEGLSVCSEPSGLQNLQFREGGRCISVLEEGHLRQDSSTIRALVRSPP